MKELDLNFDELAYAFDDPTSGSSYYLDLETGSIILVRPDLEDVGTLRGDIEMEPDRYLFVPGPQTNQFQLDVEDFAFRLTDEKLKSMVELVLSAPNKHASLRAVLQKVPGGFLYNSQFFC